MRILKGLPPYGAEATPFPADWHQSGREGLVVELEGEFGRWVANFRPGMGGLTLAAIHPNRRDAVVIADGDLWIVDATHRSATLLGLSVDAAFEVHGPDGWIFSRQGVALFRFGPQGLIWHTRRLSWDGFDQLSSGDAEVTGLAWSPLDGRWHPFRVDAANGRSSGGSFFEADREGWERLAD